MRDEAEREPELRDELEPPELRDEPELRALREEPDPELRDEPEPLLREEPELLLRDEPEPLLREEPVLRLLREDPEPEPLLREEPVLRLLREDPEPEPLLREEPVLRLLRDDELLDPDDDRVRLPERPPLELRLELRVELDRLLVERSSRGISARTISLTSRVNSALRNFAIRSSSRRMLLASWAVSRSPTSPANVSMRE